MGVLTRSALAVASVFLFVAGAACTTVLGVDDYRAVECVGDCVTSGPVDGAVDGAAPSDASPADTADPYADATLETGTVLPDGGCVATIPLTVTLVGGSTSLSSEPSLYDVAPGETETHCLAEGTSIRLRVASGSAQWTGATCEDGQLGDRCELVVNAPTSVTATVQ